MTIRSASPGDENAILEVLAEAFEPYRAQYTSGAYADTVLTPAMLRRLLSMTVLVAVDDADRVVGTVAYRAVPPGEGHMRGMATGPGKHGSGVALSCCWRKRSSQLRGFCTARL